MYLSSLDYHSFCRPSYLPSYSIFKRLFPGVYLEDLKMTRFSILSTRKLGESGSTSPGLPRSLIVTLPSSGVEKSNENFPSPYLEKCIRYRFSQPGPNRCFDPSHRISRRRLSQWKGSLSYILPSTLYRVTHFDDGFCPYLSVTHLTPTLSRL